MGLGCQPGVADKTSRESANSTDTGHRSRKCKKGYNGASFLTRVFYCWLDPLIWLGFRKKHLHQEDLYETPNYALSQDVLAKFEKRWEMELERKAKGKEPRLWVPVWCLIWPRLLLQCSMATLVIAANVLQSIIVGWLTDYFTQPSTPESTKYAYIMALMIALIEVTNAIFATWEYQFALESGIRTRAAVTGALFKKSVGLHLQTIGDLSVGKIMSLSANDVRRFDDAFLFVHYLILAPLHNLTVLLLLWFYLGLGPSCLPGIALLLLQLPLQYLLSSIFMHLRLKSAEYTDERVKTTSQFVSGIRVLKMYGWEYAFKKLVSGIRKKEAFWVFLANLFRAGNSAIIDFSSALINLLMFSTYVLTTGNSLTSSMVFTTLSLVTFVRMISSNAVSEGVLGIRELNVAFRRLQDFLLTDLSNQKQSVHYSHKPKIAPELPSNTSANGLISTDLKKCVLQKNLSASVKVTDMAAAWNIRNDNGERPTLQNITFECSMANRMLAIVGPVGAGKSTILYCLLGELEPLRGDIAIVGSLGYVAQEPWLFNGSLRDNILFGLEFEEEWYQKVVDGCCLREDIEQLPFGDMTLVGERGVSLSGGQKARVSLARAVYRKADIYLLDDPLSAVDTAVGRLLFENCLCGLLKDSIVVLVTHQLQYAQMAENMLVISQGQPIAYGNYEEIMQRSSEDEGVAATLDEMLTGLLDKENVSLTDGFQNQTMEGIEYYSEPLQRRRKMPSISEDTTFGEPDKFSNVITEEDKGGVRPRTHLSYFKAGGGYVFNCFMIVLFLVTQGNLVTADWYLSQWSTTSQTCLDSNSTGLLCNFTINTIVEIYSGLVGGAVLLSILRAVLFYFLCVNAARKLHNMMFGAILRAPVRFFDRNPIGRVLVRFSKDLYFLDNVLPRQFFYALDQSLQCLSILIMSGVANWYMFISGAAIIIVLRLFWHYYSKPAMEMKRLEAAARSPVYSHIADTLQGLTTIRACKRVKASIDTFFSFLDENSKGWIFYFTANRWFVVRSDLISSVFVGIVAFSSIPLAGEINAGLIGLSLVYTLSLATTVRFIIRMSAEIDGNMISAARIIEYTKLQPEAPLETPPGKPKPPDEWPQKGAIHLHKLKFRYAEDTPYILKGISADIKTGEKVGIVGRTGAGKSSLMQALFRMAEPEGTIQIDGVSITEVGLHTLRKKLSIIPQDPVIFSGSVRYNLDPFCEYSDEAIWVALEQVQLKEVVAVMPGGLDSTLTEGGSNFSVGQRQLMCLARALLKRNRILVIDEATANVDRVTDAIIQRTIRREFADCTTLTIAHRLNTIMDSDRIMVLSGGRMVEFDTPQVLLQNKESLFTHLVEQLDPKETRQLKHATNGKYRKTDIS